MIPYILLVVAFVLLAKGADVFIEGASNIAQYLRVSPLLIGLSIAAIGTSAPEAAVSIKASLAGVNGIAFGNVVGSNIANICLAIGIAALIKPLHFESSTIRKENPFMIFITVLMMLFVINFASQKTDFVVVSRIEGIIFLLLFIGFIFYLYRMAQQDRKENHDKVESHSPLLKNLFLTILGGAAIAYGGHLAVENAAKIATMWGVSDKVIGMSVVALGTSIPEIVTSIVAVIKGKVSIAIGNIVGSNIFNILFVLGIASTIKPIILGSDVVYDVAVCLAVSLLFFASSRFLKSVGRIQGLILISIYGVYMFFLFK
ncbi:MAG: calcium/sodium antiporter [Candidatus Celaenobacter antarcticus]|nr:calcium/sodium antiporter [Candidatus Celaenobacter antarcticus]MDP8314033.1 calcium/sodium antiporter [Candidatus Celaenobacter antarcticus]